MSPFNNVHPWPWLVSVSLLAACVSTKEMPHSMQSAQEAANSTIGAHIRISEQTPNTIWQGELVAVEADSVFLFHESNLLSIPKQSIREAKLFVVDYPLSRKVVLWTTLGVLSTASHGGYLIISAPIWLLTGLLTNVAVVNDADGGDLCFPDAPWDEIRKYARFPQGLPFGLDRSRLHSIESSSGL